MEGIVCQHLTVARVAEGVGVSWNTANNAVLAEGKRVLIDDAHRFNGVKVIGVSRDPMKKHEKFISKYDLAVPLASDEDGRISEAEKRARELRRQTWI